MCPIREIFIFKKKKKKQAFEPGVLAFQCALPSQTSRLGSWCIPHPPVLDPLWTGESEGRALDWF